MDCNFRALLRPDFFKVIDMALLSVSSQGGFSFIALSNLNKTLTKPYPVNEAILQIRFNPQKEDKTTEIKIVPLKELLDR